MTKVKRLNSTQPLANAKGGHWVKASDYDALAAKLAGVEAERDKFQDYLRKTHADWEKALDRAAAPAPDLLTKAKLLRAAQRAYIADRGNEELGKKVAIAAEHLDAAIAALDTP